MRQADVDCCSPVEGDAHPLFLFTDAAPPELYTLSLHDALPILLSGPAGGVVASAHVARLSGFDDIITLDMGGTSTEDRKSTRLNSSHITISYAVFCLTKKKT